MKIPVQNKWLNLDGLRVHYLAGGAAGTPVILLHGGGSDWAGLAWPSLMNSLAKYHRVFAPDLPGFGRSDKPDREYTAEFYRDFLEALARALGLDHFSLLGSSMGGMVAVAFTLKFPRKVDRLVLVDSAGLGAEGSLVTIGYFLANVPSLYHLVRGWATRSQWFVQYGLRDLVCDGSAITEEVLKEVRQAISLVGEGRAWQSFLRNEATLSGFHDYSKRLQEIACPTLIIHGSRDKLVPVSCARKAHLLISDSILMILSQCGHWPAREKTLEFNQAVGYFLGRS
ncbi:MAG: alpha/beta fold hydrolase [Acidobacteriota bacterium]